MKQPLIELRDVSKTFDTTRALESVNLAVRSGETLAVLGCNGSGKSTLARVLSGAISPDGGEVLYRGESISDEELRSCVGVSPQSLQVFENMTALENLRLGGEGLSGNLLRNRKQLEKEAAQLLSKVGLNVLPSRKAGRLSYAEKYLLQFARVLSRGNDAIVLDEITAALTAPEIARLHAILHDLNQRGAGIVFITHNAEEAMQHADRVAVLRDGRLEWEGTSEEARKQDLAPLMFGETRTEHYPKLPIRPGQTVLEVRNLNTAFVQDLSFKLHRSEIVGIAGVAGSGRSRVLRAVAGLDPRTSGEIVLDGSRVKGPGPYRGIGFLPEDRDADALFLNLGTGCNITIQSIAAGAPFAKFGIDFASEDVAARDLIERLGIRGATPRTPIADLSNGSKQKAVISRCVSSRCQVYLFDEPTQAVDAAGKVEIYNILNRLLAIGAGVVLASSDLTELASMCDRIFIVRRGVVVAEVTREDGSLVEVFGMLADPERDPDSVADSVPYARLSRSGRLPC